MTPGDLLSKKILVRATNWIGDAVMSIPALEALRASLPSAEIVLLAKPWVSELYWHHPAVNRLIIYDAEGEHKGPRGFWRLAKALRAEEFEAAVLFQNAFHAAWLAWCARIPVRIGYARDGRDGLLTDPIEAPSPSAYGHQAYYYLHLLLRAGMIEKPAPIQEVRLVLSDAERKWAAKRLESIGLRGPRFLVGLNPGASFGPAKRWGLERYADLANRMVSALHADVLIFGTQQERPLAEAIAAEMKHKPTVLAGETKLRQLLALLAQCRLVVSNDSGPMHLAAALGRPLVAVFGSTDERATGPLGPRVRVVRHQVDCSPCGLRECPIDFRCMTGVSVDDVYRAALEMVKQTEKE
jgi:heptosyltransferase-2